MSDTMLLGVLRMPIADGESTLTLRQFINRARQAADRIEADAERIAALEAELELRRKSGSASERLHNLCESIREEADGSAFSREEWNRIDAENLAMRKRIAALDKLPQRYIGASVPLQMVLHMAALETALGQAKVALGALLTHMGMDEDEWNKPTFDQARAVLRAIEEVQR